MPNDKDTQIKKALEAATPGPLHADDEPWPGNELLRYWVGDHEDGIGAFIRYEDAHLAANAPEWLRYLLQQNEQQQAEIEFYARNYANKREQLEHADSHIEELQSLLQQSREENERLNESIQHWSHCYSKLSESKQRLIKQIQNGEEIRFATLDGSQSQQLRGELEQVLESVKCAHSSLTWCNTDSQVPHAVWHLEQILSRYTDRGDSQ